MTRTFSESILAILVLLLCQCSTQPISPTESTDPVALTFETTATSPIAHVGSNSFWAQYRCLNDSGTSSACDVKYLEIGDSSGVIFQVTLEPESTDSDTLRLILYNGQYDLSVIVRSFAKKGEESNTTGKKEMLRFVIAPSSAPSLKWPPCIATTSLMQQLSTKPYSLDSVRVSNENIITWITYQGGVTAPQFELVARRNILPPISDTTDVFLRFVSGNVGGSTIRARLGFNLRPLSDLIARQSPCLCISPLRVYHPENNWSGGYELETFSRSTVAQGGVNNAFYQPIADGNYWIYSGFCPSFGKATSDYDGEESLSVAMIASESCKNRFVLTSSINYMLPTIIEECDGRVFINGDLWSPEIPITYFSYTVPAGTFDSCYSTQSTFWFNGDEVTIYAKGIGMIQRKQLWFSVHSGDSYYCKSELLRYHVSND